LGRKVDFNVSPVNLGCRKRIQTGLSWSFDLVEQAIILEDDCIPSSSFFPFCEELLQKYRDDKRVGLIGGANFQLAGTDFPEVIIFTLSASMGLGVLATHLGYIRRRSDFMEPRSRRDVAVRTISRSARYGLLDADIRPGEVRTRYLGLFPGFLLLAIKSTGNPAIAKHDREYRIWKRSDPHT
jgi:hypothetical protein